LLFKRGGQTVISFIWAEDENGVIGSSGKLPWHLPEDMKYFRQTTMGHAIVSGSRTFRSYNRALPGRENIVLSSKDDFPDDVVVIHSVKELCQLVKQHPNKNYFVTGGANLFSQLRNQVDRLYRTKIHHTFKGDTVMPTIDYRKFSKIQSIIGVVDQKNKYPHTFEVYQKTV
jgi:dihydrofolate reductase